MLYVLLDDTSPLHHASEYSSQVSQGIICLLAFRRYHFYSAVPEPSQQHFIALSFNTL
ncbi:hypothetical protein [Rubritalea tangerina]|uniref:hypothetical protein n=1 Tax=Rubritalea tangerina TaxID=430798 RepID=UPI00362382E9